MWFVFFTVALSIGLTTTVGSGKTSRMHFGTVRRKNNMPKRLVVAHANYINANDPLIQSLMVDSREELVVRISQLDENLLCESITEDGLDRTRLYHMARYIELDLEIIESFLQNSQLCTQFSSN